MVGRKRKRLQRKDDTFYKYYGRYGECIPDNVKQLFVDSSVPHLFPKLCYDRKFLVQVHLPIGLKTIQGSAFRGCEQLRKISIPFTVETIERAAFWCCTSLSKVSLSEGLRDIFDAAFFKCERLLEIEIPFTVGAIQQSVFAGCSMLTTVKLPVGLFWIGSEAFDKCSSLTAIDIPCTVTRIYDCAFARCRKLQDVYISDGVKKIGSHAFMECTSLTRIRLPTSIVSIGCCSFKDCYNLVTVEVEFLEAEFGHGVFHGCSKLTNISIPKESTVSICCFNECDNLLEHYGEHNVVDALQCRFQDCEVHSLCYESYSTDSVELRELIVSTNVDGEFQNTVDSFGRTPFHTLTASATKDRIDLLEVLLDTYPSHMLGWKDKYGLRAIEYLPATGERSWDKWYESILQRWMIERLFSWGKEHWIFEMGNMVQSVLEGKRLLGTAIFILESYETKERISLLELWLWRMQILIMRKQTFFSRQSIDRLKCRNLSGASFVVPTVMEFIGIDKNRLCLSDSDESDDEYELTYNSDSYDDESDDIDGLQTLPTRTVFGRPPILFTQQSTCLWSASVTAVEETSDLLTEDDQTRTSYDWDEQFEQLQSFKSEYGHCNFPKTPPDQLKKKYPSLSKFCHDQRIDYKRWLRQKTSSDRMSLRMFDRKVRLCQLEKLGFEFKPRSARWYDHFHDLLQFLSDNGHTQVKKSENFTLNTFVKNLRYIGKGKKLKDNNIPLTDSQIKLLDDIGFQWEVESYDELWDTKYKELVVFHKKYGHFMVERASPLSNWMYEQRRRRAGKRGAALLTEGQIGLLDEIEFPWKPDLQDSRWYTKYDELQRFQKQHGHCRPETSMNEKLRWWSIHQQQRHRKGRLSTEKIKLLDKLGFPLELQQVREWQKMYNELVEYFDAHGQLELDHDDDPNLYDWMAIQRQRYHGIAKPTLSDEQIGKLQDVHFCWSLDWRERTWHKKYTEVVELFKEYGHVRVTKKDNPSLYNWIQAQEKRYKELKGQQPLSEEQLEMLEQIDFAFFDGQPRMAWDTMYGEVARYREENDGRFPTSHKDDPDLNRWVRQQRYRYRCEYGYAALSDKQKALLESIDFPMYPKGKQRRYWYEMYDALVNFRKQHGHFSVGGGENAKLQSWVNQQRMRFNGTAVKGKPLSKLQLYLLERIGFTWASNRLDIEWQKYYDEVFEFFEDRGHCPTMSRSPKLGKWVQRQRGKYRGKIGSCRELSEYQIQQLEKIGFRGQ